MNKWSISRLQSFEECPQRVKLRYIDKIPHLSPEEPDDSPRKEGIRIHKMCEDYLLNKTDDLPPEVEKYQAELHAIRILAESPSVDVSVERNEGATRKWEYVDNWKDACLLLAMDVSIYFRGMKKVLVIDLKTGKPEYGWKKIAEQAQLYMILCFLKYPDLEEANSEVWFVKYGKEHIRKLSLTREKAMSLLEKFRARSEKMMAATTFPSSPSQWNCRFCPYGPDKPKPGGDACPDGV